MSKYIDADVLITDYLNELRGTDDEPRLIPQSVTPTVAAINAYDNIKRVVENMPAADVKPMRHGEWIEDDYGFFHCSECGFEWNEPERTGLYCPGCGARNGHIVIIDEV